MAPLAVRVEDAPEQMEVLLPTALTVGLAVTLMEIVLVFEQLPFLPITL